MKRILVALSLVLLTVGCSSGGTTVTHPSSGGPSGVLSTTPPAATGGTGSTGGVGDVTGTWTGTWQSDAAAVVSGTFTMQFAQVGNEISGPITVDGSVCVTQGRISGAVQGDQIEFGAVQAENRVAYTGTISGDSMSGTYSAPDCGPDTGTWKAERSG